MKILFFNHVPDNDGYKLTMGTANLRSKYKAGYIEFCEILINASFNHFWSHKRNNTIEIRRNKKANRRDLDSNLFDFFEYFASNCRKHD